MWSLKLWPFSTSTLMRWERLQWQSQTIHPGNSPLLGLLPYRRYTSCCSTRNALATIALPSVLVLIVFVSSTLDSNCSLPKLLLNPETKVKTAFWHKTKMWREDNWLPVKFLNFKMLYYMENCCAHTGTWNGSIYCIHYDIWLLYCTAEDIVLHFH